MCEGKIEKSVPRDNRLSSLGRPRDAKRQSEGRTRIYHECEGIFYSTLTLMIDSYDIAQRAIQVI